MERTQLASHCGSRLDSRHVGHSVARQIIGPACRGIVSHNQFCYFTVPPARVWPPTRRVTCAISNCRIARNCPFHGSYPSLLVLCSLSRANTDDIGWDFKTAPLLLYDPAGDRMVTSKLSRRARLSRPKASMPGVFAMTLQLAKPAPPNDDKRWKMVEVTMRRSGYASHALIETLHRVQGLFGYLDEPAMHFVAESLGSAAEQGVWRRHVLSPVLAQTAGQAHVRDLHGHGLLHQGRRRTGGRDAAEVWRRAGAHDCRFGTVRGRGALHRCVRPGTGRRRGRRRCWGT